MSIELLMIVGFCLAAYSIVGNDVPQTLGTFISSNSHRPWWVLWLFASTILAIVLLYGWWASGIGDAAYGRLETIPYPEGGMSWLYIVPPILLIILTKYGIPVSTTFLVLTIFSPSSLSSMLTKSVMGYAVAFVVAILVYRFVIRKVTVYFSETKHESPNIFVYVPRQVPFEFMLFAVATFVVLMGVIFYQRGGAIQNIINTKTGVEDIRAATIIDFIYALILLVFKEWSNIPMSTTWVFLGLLAGREFAISMHMVTVDSRYTARNISKDAMKLLLGLAVSILLATGLPWLYQHINNWIG